MTIHHALLSNRNEAHTRRRTKASRWNWPRRGVIWVWYP